MDPKTLSEQHNEFMNTMMFQKAEIQKVLLRFQEKREWLYYLSQLLDIFEISNLNDRLVIVELIEKCDKKYGIYATFKELNVISKL